MTASHCRPSQCKRFISLVLDADIIPPAFHFFGMKSLEDAPSKHGFSDTMASRVAVVKQRYLASTVRQFLNQYVLEKRIFSFDFSKAFDSVPHDILCSKLKSLDINPYVTNWIISFLQGRKQRVTVDGIVTDYLNINRGVPQGTVLGPILFSIMVNDIKVILPNQNLLVKFADDLTLSIPVKSGVSNSNSAANEVQSIVEWTRKRGKCFLKANPLRLYQLLWFL